MLKGETILSGVERMCDCNVWQPFKVLESNAGFYIGTACNVCGPWSRESGYYPDEATALRDLSFINPDVWKR